MFLGLDWGPEGQFYQRFILEKLSRLFRSFIGRDCSYRHAINKAASKATLVTTHDPHGCPIRKPPTALKLGYSPWPGVPSGICVFLQVFARRVGTAVVKKDRPRQESQPSPRKPALAKKARPRQESPPSPQSFAAQRRNHKLVAVGKIEMEKRNGRRVCVCVCVCNSTAKNKAAAKVAAVLR
jgi:hypothetical protein